MKFVIIFYFWLLKSIEGKAKLWCKVMISRSWEAMETKIRLGQGYQKPKPYQPLLCIKKVTTSFVYPET